MTNASGINAVAISEYVLCIILMFTKQMPFFYLSQQRGQWEHSDGAGLRGKTVGIVGLGHIGREVARLCKNFGMKVIATRRSATENSRARNVDRLIPRQRLPELLSESDFVALTLPLTSETTHLIGKNELQHMKSTAYIINVGRGKIIDEEALVDALENHRIAGAGLDVFDKEPLPPDSKLWNLPNVILTPHISGSSGKIEDDFSKTTKIFSDNLKRFLAGKRLLHLVNKKRGY
jgi:phosphoglycerate dehydrogenase-like enzyme